MSSVPAQPVIRCPVLVPNGQDAYSLAGWLVDDRVWEDSKGINSLRQIKRGAKSWVLGQELRYTFKFIQIPTGKEQVHSLLIESSSIRHLLLCLVMDRVPHFRPARSLAMTASPGLAATAPDSISSSLRLASFIHASSIERSWSRLARSLSRRRERSI